MAAKDIGVSAASGLTCFRYYIDRKFEYANAGVMLFDMRLGSGYFTPETVRLWIDIAYENGFCYADQDVFNAMNVIDCSLPPKYNCFRFAADRIPDVKIVHYTAEIGVKDVFSEMISKTCPDAGTPAFGI